MTALRMSQAKGEGANGRSPRNQPDKAGHRNVPPQAARKSAVQNYAERMVSSHHKTYGTTLLIKYVKTSLAAKKVSVCYRTEELTNGA